MVIKKHYKTFLPFLLMGVLFLVPFLISTKIPENSIRQAISKSGSFGPLVLILILWSTNIIAPLSASPFLFVGFYLYGNNVVLYAYVAAIIASVSNFWIARKWGRTLVQKLAGTDSLEKIDKLASDCGMQTLLIFRLFLREFHDVVSYAYGLTEMNFKK